LLRGRKNDTAIFHSRREFHAHAAGLPKRDCRHRWRRRV
jgi:hypothetical protein